MKDTKLVTLTFFRYESLLGKVWAFWMMLAAHFYLRGTKGLVFYKLLGCGKEGFNPWPDWSSYAILQVWESESSMADYFESHTLPGKYRRIADGHLVFFLRPLRTMGTWAGKDPFGTSSQKSDPSRPIAVLTRATIKAAYMKRFWEHVPKASLPFQKAEGMQFYMGVGEVPVLNMATFSYWSSEEDMMAYAYRAEGHIDAIRKTRELQWYSEELFARFCVEKVSGSWPGFSEILQT